MIIDTRSISDADLAGEVLRRLCFTDEGYGAYSNHNLREGFEPLAADDPLVDELIALMGPSFGAFEDDPDGEAREIRERGAFFRRAADGMQVAWYWDHDGVLVFRDGAVVLINDDCKKSEGWRFEISIDKDVDPEAQAMLDLADGALQLTGLRTNVPRVRLESDVRAALAIGDEALRNSVRVRCRELAGDVRRYSAYLARSRKNDPDSRRADRLVPILELI